MNIGRHLFTLSLGVITGSLALHAYHTYTLRQSVRIITERNQDILDAIQEDVGGRISKICVDRKT